MTRATLLCLVLILGSAINLFAASPCPATAAKAGADASVYAATGLSNPTSFSIRDRGAASFGTNGTDGAIGVGWARVQPNSGSTTPAGFLMFRFRQNNVLVSEATVPAAQAVTSGRIYAEVNGPVNTGLAIANPNGTPVLVSFNFTDENGATFGNGSFTLGANSQIARFLNESPFNGSGSIRGTMTFTASAPVGVIALRGFTNERGEFLITTLPVADIASTSGDVVFFPHYADGGGWTTQVVLVNATDSTIGGTVQFLGPGGSTSSYSIAPRSSRRIATSGAGGSINVGAIRVTPTAGNPSPSGLSIFTFKIGGVTVSEAGVPVLRAGSAFRMYVEDCGDYVGQLQTGVAIANPSTTASATVTLELTDLSGNSTGMTSAITVPPSGQVAKFMKEFTGFGGIPYPFHGVVRITTSAPAGVAVVGLRGRYNERRDFLITTAMPSNEATAPSTTESIFAHMVDGGGYSTEFILFSGSAGQASTGMLRFFTQSGGSM